VDEAATPAEDATLDSALVDVGSPTDSFADTAPNPAVRDTATDDTTLPSAPFDAAYCDAAGYPDVECMPGGGVTGERCSPCKPCTGYFYCLTGCCIKEVP